MDFNKFQSMSTKARMNMVQERLRELGYADVPIDSRRNRATVKAIQKIQRENGIVPNGVLCRRTYDILFKSYEA